MKVIEGDITDIVKGVIVHQVKAVTEDLLVVHAFSQFGYGNAGRTGKVYTDMEKLVKILSDVCKKYSDRNIYIPCGIGCGLAGGNWEELVRRINKLPFTVVELPEK